MAKMIVVFLTFFLVFFIGLWTFYRMHKRDKMKVIKIVTYSIACSILCLTVLTTLVILF